MRADGAVAALRDALGVLGVPEGAWSGVRSMVDSEGLAYVEVGVLPAEVVERLAEVVRGADRRPAREERQR